MRRRPRQLPRTEPDRSLAQLRARGTWLHLDASDGRPRHPRVEPELQVAWWWHGADRTVVLGSRVVSILRPSQVHTAPLRFTGADQIVVVGGGGPAPGDVDRARGTDLTLTPPVPAWPTSQVPETRTPRELTPLLDREVTLEVRGGHTVEHRGMLRRDDTADLPVPRGRLVAARAGGGHLVLILDDGTVAVVHEPCRIRRNRGGSVRLDGRLGRVVLDLPDPAVHVAREATLHVRSTA